MANDKLMSLTEEMHRLMGVATRPWGPWAADTDDGGEVTDPLEEAKTPSPWARANKAIRDLEKVALPWIKDLEDLEWESHIKKMDKDGWHPAALYLYVEIPTGKSDWELYKSLFWKLRVEVSWSKLSQTDPRYKVRVHLTDKVGQNVFKKLIENQSADDITDLKALVLTPNKSRIKKALDPGQAQKKAIKKLVDLYKTARGNLNDAKDKMEELSTHLEKKDFAAVKVAAQELQSLLSAVDDAGKRIGDQADTVITAG